MDAFYTLVGTAGTLGILDIWWLTYRKSYHDALFRAVQGGRPLQFRILPAIIVYALLTIALYMWAIQTAKTRTQSAINGAIVGFILYAFYDFTNYATLVSFPLEMVFVDSLWGTVAGAIAAFVGYAIKSSF